MSAHDSAAAQMEEGHGGLYALVWGEPVLPERSTAVWLTRMPHHRHGVPMSTRPRAQHAETVLDVVVGHSLDQARQHFPGIRLRSHADHRVSRSIPGILLLIHASCDFDVVALRDLAAFNDFGINAAIAVAEVASGFMLNIVRSISLGAEDYLRKPVNQVLLKARIGASLEKKRLRDQQKAMVRRFATSEVADDMLRSGFALGGKRIHASVLFSDIRGFTALVESQGPEEIIDLLNTYYMLMFDAIGSHGGVVNQMIGDGLMALFGAPLPLEDCAGSAVAAGMEMLELIEQFNHERSAASKPGIRIGIGIATGDVVAGYTGTQQRATYTCIGDTVNLAARLEARTKVTGGCGI